MLCILILLAGFFTAVEVAFDNISRKRIKVLAGTGDKRAELVLNLMDNDKSVMATALLGKVITYVTAVSVATIIANSILTSYHSIILTVSMILIIMLFSEIIPRSVFIKCSEEFALFSSKFLRFFITILTPLNYIFSLLEKLIDKIYKCERHPSKSEDELMTMVDEVENEGGIDQHEGDLIRSAIEFNDLDVDDILTPRIDIVAIDSTDSMEDIKELFMINGYSRLPVYSENIDHIVGVIHEKDFYIALNRNVTKIDDIISNVLYVTPGMKISQLLKELQQSKTHMAIVVDEYGGTAGLVTMEDIIEELVGEIWDEHDEVVELFKKVDDNSYLISCSADLDDMFDLLGIEMDDDSELDDVSTVNGWLMKVLGKIPEQGENFEYDNLDITVTKAESKKVNEILVKKLSKVDKVTA